MQFRGFLRERGRRSCVAKAVEIPSRPRRSPRHKTPPRSYRSEPQQIFSDLCSVLVLRSVVFVSGLNAMVSVTEALPVALIPEENAVPSVRFDVIHISCLDVASCLQTLHA